MPLSLKLEVIAFNLIIISIVLFIVRKGRITIKYSLVWLFSCCVFLLFAIIPKFMETIANTFGFKVLSNMIFAAIIMILLFVSVSLTIIVSGQKEKIRLLIQEVSILKSKSK